MFLLDWVAEQKIAEAEARGELSGLPGEGRPLELGDDALVPEELRAAWRILKNAGYLPPEVQELREITALERVVQDEAAPPDARTRALRRVALLRSRMEMLTSSRRNARAPRSRRGAW